MTLRIAIPRSLAIALGGLVVSALMLIAGPDRVEANLYSD